MLKRTRLRILVPREFHHELGVPVTKCLSSPRCGHAATPESSLRILLWVTKYPIMKKYLKQRLLSGMATLRRLETMYPHKKPIYTMETHPHDPRILLTAGWDGTTVISDIFTGTILYTYVNKFRPTQQDTKRCTGTSNDNFRWQI